MLISGEFSDSSSITAQSNGKGRVSKGKKRMEVSFPVTNNSACTVIGLEKTAKEVEGHSFITSHS